MRDFCFGLAGFCATLSVLTLTCQQFVVAMVLLTLAIVAFAIGFRLDATPMNPKTQPLPYIPSAHEEVKTGLDILRPQPGNAEVAIPDIFDEARIREDLARLAHQPGPFGKYVELVRSRFNKVAERAVLEQWATYFDTGRRLIEARTEMERRRASWLQLANEHALNGKQKDSEIAKLDADMEEQFLRRDQAAYKRQNLERFIEGGQRPEPKLTPAQQRLLKKTDIDEQLQRLKNDEAQALQKSTSELEKRRLRNMYATRRDELMEQMEPLL